MTQPATPISPNAEPRCQGVRRDGTPCGVPPEMLLPDENGELKWCSAHHPDPVIQAKYRLGQAKGAARAGLRVKRVRLLSPGELGELKSPSDAQRQLAVLSEAIATGRLSPNFGNAAMRAVTAFLKAYDLEVKATRLSALERELELLKAQRKERRTT